MKRNKFAKLIIDKMNGFYIAFIICISIIGYLYYSNMLLKHDVKALKKTVNEIENYINNSSIEVSTRNTVSKDGSESISEFYSNTISRVDTVVGIVGLITALFGVSGIYLSWINLNIGKEFQDKLNKIDSLSKDVEVLNGMKHFISGLTYYNHEKHRYAIEEFEEGLKYENSVINQIQLASMYADLYTMDKENNKEMISEALSYLQNINGEVDEKNMAEFFHTKGCLYGIKALSICENDDLIVRNRFQEKIKALFNKNSTENKNKIELYEQSIKYFKKAIKLRNDQYEYYTNIALTFHYLGKDEDTISYLKLAKSVVEFDAIYRHLKIDIFDIFSNDDLLKMGINKFNKYRYQVVGKKDNGKEFEERLQKRKEEKKEVGVKSDKD